MCARTCRAISRRTVADDASANHRVPRTQLGVVREVSDEDHRGSCSQRSLAMSTHASDASSRAGALVLALRQYLRGSHVLIRVLRVVEK